MAARPFTLSKTRPLIVAGPCKIIRVGSNRVIVEPIEWQPHLDDRPESRQNGEAEPLPAMTGDAASGESANGCG